MTPLEDALRDALRAEAQALGVPRRPELDRDTRELRNRPRTRWLAAAACLVIVAAAVVAIAVRRADDTEPAPPVATDPATSVDAETTVVASSAPPQPVDVSASPFLGTWVTTDVMGRLSTMTITASGDGSAGLDATNFMWLCSGASTMTGTGRLHTESELVFAAPKLTCDDGSEPASLGIGPLSQDLRDLTFTRDPAADILTDNLRAVWTRQGSDPSVEPNASRSDAAVTELLNGFVGSRVAGVGAQRYLNLPADDVPLVYATSSGARYERGEFEPVSGIDWPYGFSAFRVRMFAGDTVVEQLFFTPAAGRLGLEYDTNGFGTDIAPTAEDGRAVSVTETAFAGEVTLQAAHPWMFSSDTYARLIPEGPDVQPTTDGGERNGWDEFFLIADPAMASTICQQGPSPTDAAALAESIRSDPQLGATAPLAVSVGGVDAVMIDVAIPAGASVCSREGNLLNPVLDPLAPQIVSNGVATGGATGELIRLYLIDAPQGSSMRILAVAIVAPARTFERAVREAAPVVDSIEFHAP